MIWKIVIIVLCLVWCLPIAYMWFSMKKIKKYEDYLDNEIDYYTIKTKAYHLAVEDMEKEFAKWENAIDNQRKIVNGWEHKIDIMDRDIRKLKKAPKQEGNEDV